VDHQLESTLRSHAVKAGLLNEGQPLPLAVADLTERVAAMCAEISEFGGNRTAMFSAADEAAEVLSAAEARYASVIASKCAAIALGHRFDNGTGAAVAIRTAFCAVPRMVSKRMRQRDWQMDQYAVV